MNAQDRTFYGAPTRLEPLPPMPAATAYAGLGWQDDSSKSLGPKYPLHNMAAPVFGGEDLAGIAVGAVITLAPLAAYAFGFGL